MSQISYFQRFSQKENHLTNNTLLMLRYVYQSAPQKLEAVLHGLLDDELEIGPQFEQQMRGAASVPDAFISQPPLSILIETKRGGDITEAQVKRHLASFEEMAVSEAGRYLLLLTGEVVDNRILERCHAAAMGTGVTLIPATFSDLLYAIQDMAKETDLSLLDVIADFEGVLREEGVLSLGQSLAVFAAGTSFKENVSERLYFEPVTRKSKAHVELLGLYQSKAVRLIAEPSCVVTGKMGKDGFEIATVERGHTDAATAQRIAASIPKFAYYAGLAEQDTRFYLWDEGHPTTFHKAGKFGVRYLRYLNLGEHIDYPIDQKSLSAQEIATALDGLSFN